MQRRTATRSRPCRRSNSRRCLIDIKDRGSAMQSHGFSALEFRRHVGGSYPIATHHRWRRGQREAPVVRGFPAHAAEELLITEVFSSRPRSRCRRIQADGCPLMWQQPESMIDPNHRQAARQPPLRDAHACPGSSLIGISLCAPGSYPRWKTLALAHDGKGEHYVPPKNSSPAHLRATCCVKTPQHLPELLRRQRLILALVPAPRALRPVSGCLLGRRLK